MLLLRLLLSVMAMVEYRFFFGHSENPARLDSFIMEMQMWLHMFLQIILLLPSVLAPVVLLCCGNGGIQISSSL
jgi:hypothetical protein